MQGHGFARLRKGWGAKFVRTVMTDNQVFHQNRQMPREVRDGLNLLMNELHSDSDMPEQAPLSRIINGASVAEFVDLANVVEDDTCQEQVGIDLGVVTAEGSRQCNQAHDMLKQSSDKSMVHGHSSRSTLQAGCNRWISNYADKQLPEPGVACCGHSHGQFGVHLLDVPFGVRQEVAQIVVPFQGRENLFQGQFFLAVEELDATAHLNNVVTFEGGNERSKVVPHFATDRASAIDQFNLEPGSAGAERCPHFLLANKEVRHDKLAVGKINHKMRLHGPYAFGIGTGIFFFFLGVSGVGGTSWMTVAPCTAAVSV